MAHAQSFPPVAASSAQVLILGSMPGQASLDAQQYYAHPRNSFWPIMGALFDFDSQFVYQKRIESVKQAGVAIWDVLQSCYRPGSLDADIDESSITANDFHSFLKQHSNIQAIFFNGAKAEQSFRKYVLPGLGELVPDTLVKLPSTSPAHAAMSFEQKLAQWAQIKLQS